MIRLLRLSTLRCHVVPLGTGDGAELSGRLQLSPREAQAMLSAPGERRVLGVRDRETGRLHAVVAITRSLGGTLVLTPRIAPDAMAAPLAGEALAQIVRALAAAHPFGRIEARCAGHDPRLGPLLAEHGLQVAADTHPRLLRRQIATARIDVC